MAAAASDQRTSSTTQPGQEHRLAGLRVLVVEDSFLAAASISRMLIDMNCRVVGPVATVEKAMSELAAGTCDAAVLDINLSGQTSEPIADALVERGIPYFFVTGYASPMLLSVRQRSHPRIHKPIAEPELRDALLRSLKQDR